MSTYDMRFPGDPKDKGEPKMPSLLELIDRRKTESVDNEIFELVKREKIPCRFKKENIGFDMHIECVALVLAEHEDVWLTVFDDLNEAREFVVKHEVMVIE